ncbi:conserved hypothetical protein [Solidesulfovibrio fructosivorans JJ]]|uniref:Transmembrane protein n=1 Tax=Solidesulfovibrio fructosivorans JJ] TaxID=596151 RepID=E1JVI9_SOLFR|nr:hypothetical protein [Solidesulfovibrio fructosivorans]EFL51477.1 conserved hypothetical protein [Solidesulfovibrio fructosivorans JJ]]
MLDQRIGVRFMGGALASLGYTALCAVLALFVIPAAWGVVAFTAWWCGGLVFSDGTRAEFTGRGGRVWPLFAVAVFLAILPSLVTAGMEHNARTTSVQLLLVLALVPFDVAVKLPIYRWLFANIRLEPGGAPRFHGRYLPYLGWVLLFYLTALTVVLWPWVATGLVRWFCDNLEGDGYDVMFVGTGWGLLWRSVVWFVGSLLLIPIPWVLRSMYRWWTDNLELVRHPADATSFPA